MKMSKLGAVPNLIKKMDTFPYINMKNRGKKHGTFFPEISSTMVN